MKSYISLLLTFFILFYVIPYIYRYSYELVESFENDIVPTASFPFKNIYTDKDKKLPIIIIGAFFRSDKHMEMYEEYKKKGMNFLGISSYLEFPGEIKNPYEDTYHKRHPLDYESMVKTWLHCFRNPKKYLKSNIPKMLMSESDFIDPNKIKPDTSIKKKYDFIYICLDEGQKHDSTKCAPGWQGYNRNWDLGKKCLEIMCGEFKLKGLIIGRTNCEITSKCNKVLEQKPFQPQSVFLKMLQEAKFIFVPNISDASPRVVTQAMCYDMPVLMNKNILGGWKYINEHTGEFFNNEKDIAHSIRKLLSKKYTPRQWFIDNYGKEKSGRKLLSFLKKNYKEVNFNDIEYVTFKKL